MAEIKQLNIEEYAKTLSALSKEEIKAVLTKVKEKKKIEDKKKASTDKKVITAEGQKVIAYVDATYPALNAKQKQSIINIARRYYASVKKQDKV